MLEDKGLKPMKVYKTGTTIVGIVFKVSIVKSTTCTPPYDCLLIILGLLATKIFPLPSVLFRSVLQSCLVPNAHGHTREIANYMFCIMHVERHLIYRLALSIANFAIGATNFSLAKLF